jgi:hypothetical protein
MKSNSSDGKLALDLMRRRLTINYGAKSAGSRPAKPDGFDLTFYLDYISIIGQPLKVITWESTHFFDNYTLSFQHWNVSYKGKQLYGLPFDLRNRTFRIATASTRETWFIVMHPIAGYVTELPPSKSEQRRRMKRSARSSALLHHHAECLASQITTVFNNPDLLGEGVEPAWKLGSNRFTKITSGKWMRFQEIFMSEWANFVSQHTSDPFWRENEPAFHAYDFGANIEIIIRDEDKIETERPIRDDDEYGSESDTDESVGDGPQSDNISLGKTRLGLASNPVSSPSNMPFLPFMTDFYRHGRGETSFSKAASRIY